MDGPGVEGISLSTILDKIPASVWGEDTEENNWKYQGPTSSGLYLISVL
jgi:hypothetical protein